MARVDKVVVAALDRALSIAASNALSVNSFVSIASLENEGKCDNDSRKQ
jgi:hypothetical protein